MNIYYRVFRFIDAEEEEKAEAPEKSLLESGGNEVRADGVADFHQKEARSGSNDADRVNGGHHVTERGLDTI